MEENEKKRIQLQLRQYLKDYRNRNSLAAEKAAERLGIEIATYRNLEGKRPNNRLITSLEYIHKFAYLSGVSVNDFISFLTRNRRTVSGSLSLKRSLFRWEKSMLDLFDKVGIPDRESFIKTLQSSETDFPATINILNKLLSLESKTREKLFELIDVMVERHET